jgi:hypothetical protein
MINVAYSVLLVAIAVLAWRSSRQPQAA